MKGLRYYIREWLNLPGQGSAFVEAEVEDTSKEVGDMYYGGEGGIIILKDCSRQIQLDFPCYTAEQRENSLAKLNLLLGTLKDFRRALEAECALSEEREARRDLRFKQELERSLVMDSVNLGI